MTALPAGARAPRYAPAREAASTRARGRRAAAAARSRRPTSRSRSRSARSPGRSRLVVCLVSTSPIACSLPDDARTMVVVPDAADERRRRWRRCSSTSRCSRSATSIRASISRSSATSPTPMSRELPAIAAILAAARAGHRATSIGGSAPNTRIGFFCFIAPAAGTRGNTRGWGGSASAARSRNSTGCCEAPPTRASPSRSASWPILPSVRYCITLDTDTRLPRDAAKAARSASSRIR